MADNSNRSVHVSDAELAILQVMWQHGAMRVAQIQEYVHKDGKNWAYNTVQTLLSRLESKGAVVSKREGRANLYQTCMTRKSFVNEQLDDLAHRIYDGASAPVMLAFVEHKGLSKKEIQQFRVLLDRLETESED